jgi:hypothetical protein
MSLQKKTAPAPSSVKIEMTQKQLEMMVYMLGAIDLRTDPATLEVALDLRKKLANAQKVFTKQPERPKDKYGRHLTDEEIKNAQEIARTTTGTDSESTPSVAFPANPQ